MVHSQLVLGVSNVAPLQAKGYDLDGSITYNDIELHERFHRMRSRGPLKAWFGLYATLFQRILPFMFQHCEALVADGEVMQRARVRRSCCSVQAWYCGRVLIS